MLLDSSESYEVNVKLYTDPTEPLHVGFLYLNGLPKRSCKSCQFFLQEWVHQPNTDVSFYEGQFTWLFPLQKH